MHETGADRRTTTVAWPPGEEPVTDPGFALPPRWKVARLLGRGGQAVVCLAERHVRAAARIAPACWLGRRR